MKKSKQHWPPLEMNWWYVIGTVQKKDGGDHPLSFLFLLNSQPFDIDKRFGIHKFIHYLRSGEPIVHAYFAVLNHEDKKYEILYKTSPPERFLQLGGKFECKLGGWAICDNNNSIVLSLPFSVGEYQFELHSDTPSMSFFNKEYFSTLKWYGYPKVSVNCRFSSTGTNEGIIEYTGNGFYEYGWSYVMPANFTDFPYDGFHLLLDNGVCIILTIANWQFVGGIYGFCINTDGAITYIRKEDINLVPLSEWISSVSGVSYPISWKISIAKFDFECVVDAIIPEQELNGKKVISMRMWYGACNISGVYSGKTVKGHAFAHIIRRQRLVVRALLKFGDLYYFIRTLLKFKRI